MSSVALLQLLHHEKKTGVLRFVSPYGEGLVYMVDGHVNDAMLEAQTGTDALFTLMDWNDGEFDFLVGTVNVPEIIEQPVPYLLLEYLRIKDENSTEAAFPEEHSSDFLI